MSFLQDLEEMVLVGPEVSGAHAPLAQCGYLSAWLDASMCVLVCLLKDMAFVVRESPWHSAS
jgi:hypothetical protein